MDQFLTWIAGLLALFVPGWGAAPPPSWTGYVEADYVYVAAPAPAVIEDLAVSTGDEVAAGDLLFALEDERQQALLHAAEARVAAARAGVTNLATGSREAEIDVIRASLDRAAADLELARTQLARTKQLVAEGLAPEARLDQDRAALQSAAAQRAQLRAELQVAELPARDPLQLEAGARLRAAEAEAAAARLELAERRVEAPAAGRVDRIYYAPGETAAAGAPVVALLPASALKVRFFVPEVERPTLALGEAVAIACDGCPAGLTATIDFFAAEPQFTPPVIYSREERQRLSFLAEAALEAGAALPPGQPVTVRSAE